MKPHPSFYAFVLCAGLVSAPAFAQDGPPRQGSSPYPMSTPEAGGASTLMTGTAAQGSAPEPFAWLTKEQQTALVDTVPPAPEPGSEVDKADLAKVLEVQKSRTPEIIAECKRDQFLTNNLFEPVYGDKLTPADNPKFFKLVRHVLDVTRFVNGSTKNRFKRPRPFVGHPDVVKSLFTVNGFSYPSGHSMASYTMAIALGEVFPEKKQALLDRAHAIAQSRVDAGVHYPSDIAQGEVLGRATGAAIIANAAFQKDVAEVKAELQK